MKSNIIYLALIMILVLLGCKNNTPNPALASIDFKRGELLLCGDGQFGELKFSLSCNYETRATFDMAVALLHSFQYSESEKAFVKVIDADPNCPMAYWGVAMSIYHAAWFPPSKEDLIRGSSVLEIAKGLSMDNKQRDYINAIDAFYTHWETLDHQTRAKNFENKMEQLYKTYPDDIEAAVFYSLALYSTRDRVGKDYFNERKAGGILEALFDSNPNHPGIAHYIIHNYDNPILAQKGLETARRYAKIAPSSSHAQHMPSHIFTRLGIWEESIESNLLSASSSRCYTDAAALNGAYFEELHATDYLVYAYLQKGDNANAEKQQLLMKNLRAFYPTNITAAIYPITAIPARLALENKNWERAANLELQEIDLNWEQFPWQEAIHHFAKALGAVHMNDFETVEQKIEVLKELHQNLKAQNDRTKSIQIKQVEIQIKTARAWLSFRKNDQKNGLSLMQEAAEIERNTSKHPVTPGDVLPAIELLGDMFLEMGRNEEALAAYEENLKDRPNRFNGLYGAAVAAKQAGNHEKALYHYTELIELTKDSNSTRPELGEARLFVQQSS
ncbi:MAG: tetratricopeptide repeat protein [Maribacter sp.]|nr:tetratricopeptide repeat protein [Maribacter sp.]